MLRRFWSPDAGVHTAPSPLHFYTLPSIRPVPIQICTFPFLTIVLVRPFAAPYPPVCCLPASRYCVALLSAHLLQKNYLKIIIRLPLKFIFPHLCLSVLSPPKILFGRINRTRSIYRTSVGDKCHSFSIIFKKINNIMTSFIFNPILLIPKKANSLDRFLSSFAKLIVLPESLKTSQDTLNHSILGEIKAFMEIRSFCVSQLTDNIFGLRCVE